jgi:hypothetical protein
VLMAPKFSSARNDQCRAPTPTLIKSAPNWLGSLRLQTQTSAAAATFDTVKRQPTRQALAHERLPRSSGLFDGSTTVRLAVNMNGAELRLVDP